jgi:3-phenylpropionate/cinnamic acid dioxygenase small subunit
MTMALPTRDDLIDFVLAEARALDEERYGDWLALYADDGHYWVPLFGASQDDPLRQASIAYEDRLLLELRIERLKSPRAHSLQPRSTSQHVLQQPQVEHADHDANEYRLRTPFVYVEARGEQQTLLAGTWRHRLRTVDGALRIVLKRVDLLNAHAAQPAIQLFP